MFRAQGRSWRATSDRLYCGQRYDRLFLFDTCGEHLWIPNRFYDLDEVEDFFDSEWRKPTFAASLIAEENLEEEFCRLAHLVYDWGRMVLGVEEVPMFCTPLTSHRPWTASFAWVAIGV
jgi:hypothetical protein